MNVEDIVSVAGKKLPIRVLFSLIELEAELKGASYWGTYLLYYAFDTNDSELRCEVERRLLSMGQPKYENKGKNDDKESPQQPNEVCLDNEQAIFALRCAIYEVLNQKDEDGNYLITHQNQWTAIFWCVVDLSIGIFAFEYEQFKELVERMNLGDIRVPFVMTSVNDCSKTDYRDVPSQWVCTSKSNRGRKAFDKMKLIADVFQKILAKQGLKRPQNPFYNPSSNL